ncbi:hypothetical protein JCM30471_23720 [Desulfuromonas carbonis]|uniref:GGDEF domain-containing protein n=1 Tax=Desulfuromonas sp. DDH964 TaxID=1823759 RepID=UPI00078C8D45|nr:GGDEF domain-containing protein [Desulfuromonas sp. DDH964]AMV73949.1 response receiver-modulated diguanylate cyclase [Desulfuromonas sp. DDH964]
MTLTDRINRKLERLSRPWLVVVALSATLLLGLINYWTGEELSFSLFYVAPLLLLAWYARREETYSCALLAALVWMAAEVANRSYYNAWAPFWNALVRFGFFLLVSHLVLRVRGLLRLQQALAGTDTLTGLVNGRIFYQRLGDEAQRAARYGRAYTLAYFDLDNFKQVNDSFGHGAGDQLLQAVARNLKRQLRSIDVAARLGGDEFALLLPETGFSAGGEALQKIQRELLSAMGEGDWPVTFSIGAVTFDGFEDDLDSLVRAADDLMYQAKRGGKNRLVHQLRADMAPSPVAPA